MAKRRQVQPRPVSKAGFSPSTGIGPHAAAPVPNSQNPRKPVARAGYTDAVALYEQGIAALQEHEYSRASNLFRAVLSGYPEEKELHERVRLYLNVCDRQVVPRDVAPSTPEELVFAATVALNAENYDEALTHLRSAIGQSPDNDYALYMLAAVLARREEFEEAVPHLLRAIELNHDNRALARHDPDLGALREDERIRAALDAVPAVKPAPRRVARRVR